MTRLELNNSIDTVFDDNRADDSLAPSMEGAELKKVADYAEQLIKIKTVKTTITEAQILQLFTTPITILDSTETGKIKYPTNVYIRRNAGTAYTLATASFSVINDFNAVMSGDLNPNPLTNDPVGFFQSEINVVQNLSGGERNNLYKLKANTGNPTGGAGDIDVYVTYVEITL